MSLSLSTPSPLEHAIAEAQSSGNFKNFWQLFLQSRFEVALEKERTSHADALQFLLRETPKKPYRSVQIAEDILTLDQYHRGAYCESLTGSEIIQLMPEEHGLAVLLNSRMMSISPERAEALRKSQRAVRQVTQATPVPDKVSPLAAPVSVPQQVLDKPLAVEASSLPTPLVGDISSLKPRQVSVPELGLDMFIPGAWQSNLLSRRIKISDPEFGTQIDARGRTNNGISLSQWRAMKLAELKQDYPQLQECSDITTLQQGEWSGLIQASAQELQGRLGDDEFVSKLMLCCYHLDDMLVAIVIRAPEPVFEAQRPIYKWMSTRLTILPPLDLPASAMEEETEKFRYFSFSSKGRVGRIEFFIQSLLCWLPPILAGLACVALNLSELLSAIIVSVLLLLATIMPIVRRLHDLGINGKWVWMGPALCVIALASSKGSNGYGLVFMLVNLLYLLSYLALFLVPGSKEANEYGLPPGKPGMAAKVGLIFVLILVGVGVKMQSKLYRDYVEKSKTSAQQPTQENYPVQH